MPEKAFNKHPKRVGQWYVWTLSFCCCFHLNQSFIYSIIPHMNIMIRHMCWSRATEILMMLWLLTVYELFWYILEVIYAWWTSNILFLWRICNEITSKCWFIGANDFETIFHLMGVGYCRKISKQYKELTCSLLKYRMIFFFFFSFFHPSSFIFPLLFFKNNNNNNNYLQADLGNVDVMLSIFLYVAYVWDISFSPEFGRDHRGTIWM